MRQNPVQAENREHLQELLSVASGGVAFTTIQKFHTEGEKYPQLSDRRNIVFIADEAHRSQYGLKAKVVFKPAKQKGKIRPLKPQTSLLAAESSSAYQVENSCIAGILPAKNIQETGKMPIPQSEDDIAYTSTVLPNIYAMPYQMLHLLVLLALPSNLQIKIPLPSLAITSIFTTSNAP